MNRYERYIDQQRCITENLEFVFPWLNRAAVRRVAGQAMVEARRELKMPSRKETRQGSAPKVRFLYYYGHGGMTQNRSLFRHAAQYRRAGMPDVAAGLLWKSWLKTGDPGDPNPPIRQVAYNGRRTRYFWQDYLRREKDPVGARLFGEPGLVTC